LFECEEILDPAVERNLVAKPLEAQLSLFGETLVLAAQFLAFLAAHRGLEIGLGAKLGLQQGTLFALNHAPWPALTVRDLRQCAKQRTVLRHPAEMEE